MFSNISFSGTYGTAASVEEIFNSSGKDAVVSIYIIQLLDCEVKLDLNIGGEVTPLLPNDPQPVIVGGPRYRHANRRMSPGQTISLECDTTAGVKWTIDGVVGSASATDPGNPPLPTDSSVLYNFNQDGITFVDQTGAVPPLNGTCSNGAVCKMGVADFSANSTTYGAFGLVPAENNEFQISASSGFSFACTIIGVNFVAGRQHGLLHKSTQYLHSEWKVWIQDGRVHAAVTSPYPNPSDYIRHEMHTRVLVQSEYAHLSVNFTGRGPSDEIEIYLDAVKGNANQGSGPTPGTYTPTTNGLAFGYVVVSVIPEVLSFFEGWMDDFVAKAGQLSVSEIQQLYAHHSLKY